MTRDEALTVSGALGDAGINHTIAFGYHDRMNPREQVAVRVIPSLSLSPDQIEATQAVARAVGRRIAFIGGYFEFVGENVR